jgi:hypothetical protein
MKKALLTLIAAFIIGGAGIAAQAQTTEQLTLGVNKSQKVFDRKVTVKVLLVVEDSRCPEGTQCVQAGNAKVRVSLQKGTDPSKTVELNTNGDNTAVVEGYSIKLDSLTPTPKSGAPVKSKDYAATFTVEATAATAKK